MDIYPPCVKQRIEHGQKQAITRGGCGLEREFVSDGKG